MPDRPRRFRIASFARSARAPGIAMTVGAIGAVAWANASASSYASVWESGRHVTNEWLIAVFFFVVGVEVRREMVAGELASLRRAAAPVVAALTGMVVPALIYLAIAGRGPGGHGWGIVMATDIAFAVGVLALVSSKALHERVFLMTLAVADDVLAIIVLVVFYRGGVSTGPLAGFMIGFLVPTHRVGPRRIEHALLPWVNVFVLPLFALANAGVRLQLGELTTAAAGTVFLAVVVARVIGKPIGIVASVAMIHRTGHLDYIPAGFAAAVGFTVPLLIVDAAFGAGPLADAARAGLLVASLLGAAFSFGVARVRSRPR